MFRCFKLAFDAVTSKNDRQLMFDGWRLLLDIPMVNGAWRLMTVAGPAPRDTPQWLLGCSVSCHWSVLWPPTCSRLTRHCPSPGRGWGTGRQPDARCCRLYDLVRCNMTLMSRCRGSEDIITLWPPTNTSIQLLLNRYLDNYITQKVS